MKITINYALILIFGVFILTSCNNTTNNSGSAELNNEIDSVSYSLGISIANNMKKSNLTEINSEVLMAAFDDVMEGKETKIDQKQTQMIIRGYMKNKRQREQKSNLKESNDFLAENKEKEGVKTTESGLQYKVIEEGSGKSPTAEDSVKVDYHGTLIDGTVFDSSVERGEPAVFQVNKIIKGWQEALKMMKVGGKWKLFIPPELGYGKKGAGQKIGPNEALIFEVELHEIVKDN